MFSSKNVITQAGQINAANNRIEQTKNSFLSDNELNKQISADVSNIDRFEQMLSLQLNKKSVGK